MNRSTFLPFLCATAFAVADVVTAAEPRKPAAPAKVSATPAPAAPSAATNAPAVPMNPAGEGKATDVGAKSGGRHGEYTKKAAKGPHMKVVSATFFGSDGYEEFVDAGGLPDGTVVAFGNTWGPQFPKNPDAVVLGKGTHAGLSPLKKDSRGNEHPDYACPDSSGVIVYYAGDLSTVRKIVRMDWGVANIRSGLVTENGKGLIVAGQCHPAFKTFSSGCSKVNTLPYQAPPPDPNPPPPPKKAPKKTPKQPEPVIPCDVYIARLAADSLKLEWVWLLERNGDPPEDIFVDKAGAVYFDAAGMRRISPDGAEMALVNPKAGGGNARWLGVDPSDGGVFFGGDRNTSTGQEPYRQPYMYKFDAKGQRVATLWEPDPKTIGSATGCLESDSSPRALAWAKTGDMLVCGWSDGGNSVFPRQALDWHKPATSAGMGISTWGMKNANSLGHIIRIDPKTWETKSHTWWAAFIPTWFSAPQNRGAPNFANIRQIRVLNDGSVGIVGSAATGLIQTPNGFWVDPMTGDKYGGAYVTVFLPDLSNILFSSYLPGCEAPSLGVTPKGVAVVSRSRGSDGVVAHPTISPVKDAVQKQFQGCTDAHIVLLELPPHR